MKTMHFNAQEIEVVPYYKYIDLFSPGLNWSYATNATK